MSMLCFLFHNLAKMHFNLVSKFIHHCMVADEASVDMLINNGGVMRCPRILSADGIELQLATNHLGHFLLTHLLLAKLKVSRMLRTVCGY